MTTSDTPAKAAAQRWIESVLAATGWTAARLAREAGVHPSTLNRALDPEIKFSPSLPTLQAVSRVTSIALPADLGFAPAAPARYSNGLSEPEVSIVDDLTTWHGHVLTATQWVVRVRSRALDLLGLLPDDEVLLDQGETARAGDVVCVQVYNLDRGTADTVLRRFDPPYVTTETTDAAARAKPLLVDGERAKVMAVMVRMSRRRGAA